MFSAHAALPRWTLVLPVQSAGRAKSRLVVPPGVDHAQLARAMALDTLAAVRACPLVQRRIVVTSDAVVGAAALGAGDDVVPDDGRGLGAAVTAGVARALRLAPNGAIGVLLADLPAATPDDLSLALAAAASHRSAFVPDDEGTGTVLLAAVSGASLRPSFGAGSAARHQALGAARLDLDLPRLRSDVDTVRGLQAAAALGLGPQTRSAVTGWHSDRVGQGRAASR